MSNGKVLSGDEDLLEKYNTICDKFSADIRKEFDSEPVYNFFFFLKTKTKSSGDKATDFHNKQILKAVSDYTCLAVIIVDSALKADENYHPQVFLKEYKCIGKEVIIHFTEDREMFSSDYVLFFLIMFFLQ